MDKDKNVSLKVTKTTMTKWKQKNKYNRTCHKLKEDYKINTDYHEKEKAI